VHLVKLSNRCAERSQTLFHWIIDLQIAHTSVDYQIRLTVQERVCHRDIQSIAELKQWLIQIWCSLYQDIINTAIDQWCQDVWRPPHTPPPPASWPLTFWPWNVVFESHVTWATSVPILVFLGLSLSLDLGPMYATDRRQTDRCQASDAHHRLYASALWRRGHKTIFQTLRYVQTSIVLY